MTEHECQCGRPTAGAWLCPRCQGTLAIAIANTAAYFDDLDTVLTKRARYGGQGSTKGSIGRTQPLPVDGRFTDRAGQGSEIRWGAWNTVSTWCRVVMEEQPERIGPACASACLHTSCAAVRRTRWPADTMRSMCLYLDRQFRWIVREQWVTELMDELLDVERRLKRIVDRPADRWYAGKCSAPNEDEPDCPTDLYAQADRGWIDCPTCGIRHDVAERRTILLAEAKGYLVTATEAAGALIAWTDYDGTEVNLVKRISEWHARGRLEAHGSDHVGGKDRQLYRLGDVQVLLVEWAQHAQQRRLATR